MGVRASPAAFAGRRRLHFRRGPPENSIAEVLNRRYSRFQDSNMPNISFTRRAFVAGSAASAARVLGANDRIRIGLIGTGSRATDHIRDLTRLKDLNLTIAATC